MMMVMAPVATVYVPAAKIVAGAMRGGAAAVAAAILVVAAAVSERLAIAATDKQRHRTRDGEMQKWDFSQNRPDETFPRRLVALKKSDHG